MSEAVNWKNVNNWHWIEKDCTFWAHERLMKVLPTINLQEHDLKIVKVNKVDGEVSVNVRKGRIRQIYDLTIEFTYTYDEEEYTGKIVDYMSDTEESDFEVICRDILEVSVREDLKKSLWNILFDFRKQVELVQGSDLLVEGSNTGNTDSTNNTQDTPKDKVNNSYQEKVEKKPIIGKEKFTEKVEFTAPLSQVFNMLTNPQHIMAWSRGTAQLTSFSEGSSFTLFHGNVQGKVLVLADNKMIKMEWRLKDWCEPSIVDISFKGDDGHTDLSLTQTGVPSSEIEAVKENWHRYYWDPIKTILGCSYNLN